MNVLTLLPVKLEELDGALADYCKERSTDSELSLKEIELRLNLEFEVWLSGERARILPRSVGGLLNNVKWFLNESKALKTTPATLYAKVLSGVQETMSVTRREAAVAASHLPLILILAREFKYSSAGIAAVINGFGDRMALHWKGVDSRALRSNVEQGTAEFRKETPPEFDIPCSVLWVLQSPRQKQRYRNDPAAFKQGADGAPQAGLRFVCAPEPPRQPSVDDDQSGKDNQYPGKGVGMEPLVEEDHAQHGGRNRDKVGHQHQSRGTGTLDTLKYRM